MPQCSQLSRDWGQEWFLEFCVTYLKLITKILNVNIRGIRANSLDISFIMQKKKGKCWKKKNTLENDSLFILKQVDLLTYILSQTKRSTQNTLRLKDPKFKVGDKD